MSSTDRSRQGWAISNDTVLLYFMGALMGVMLAGYGFMWAGYWWAGEDTNAIPRRVIAGEAQWHTEHTILAGVIVGTIIFSAVTIIRVWSRKVEGEYRIDRAAQYMAQADELAFLTAKGQKKAAHTKGINGPLLPKCVLSMDNDWLLVGPESTACMIAGPRGGKTSCMVIPRIVEWDGPVVTTSNKGDIVRLTRAWRERGGNRAWVFDPQGIIGERASWYWDPISFVVGRGEEGMDVRAAKLANRFAFSTGTHSKVAGGDYFNATGEGLIAGLLLACALERRPIMAVRDWVTDPSSALPAEVLRRAGYSAAADGLAAIRRLNADQRDGVYGTADTMTKFLTYRSVQPWITRGGGRSEFDPELFVRSKDTLYSISKEGQGSMGPLVTALTVAVCEAAEHYAERSPGGRLAVPMGVVLDEVANVCRWADLPHAYSHYGSKGIILIAFFQSWSQGAEVWGDAGMKALWSQSRTRIIGSGIAENGFLESVSHMIGDYMRASHSSSWSDRGTSGSVQGQRDTILSVADLTAIPEGRSIMVEAGVRPALVKLVPWWDRPYAKALKASAAPKPPETPANGHRAYHVPVSTVRPRDEADDYTTAEVQ